MFTHVAAQIFVYVVGCGASLLMISGSIIINQRFTDRRTIAMGVGSIGGAIGNIVLPLFTSWCIDVYNWRGTFILLGGLCLQGVIAGVAFYSGDNIETSDDKKEKLAGIYLLFIINIIAQKFSDFELCI